MSVTVDTQYSHEAYQGEEVVTISVKKYSEKHKQIAKDHGRVLFIWEMDKRFVPDENDRAKINVIGTMSREKCKRIWKIIAEHEE